jgi:hypothetical protein
MPAPDAQNMLQAYVTRSGGERLTRAPLLDSDLRAGADLTLAVDVAPGDYFLVLDHSASAGRSPPAAGQQAAKVDYLVQLGER